MRHGTTGRRQRNNRSGQRSGQQRNKVFDSNGPDVRIRGTAHQVAEKYEALAKDATGAGDRILAESYLQHAEHYLRIIASWDNEVSDDMRNDDEDRTSSSRSGSSGGGNSGQQDKRKSRGGSSPQKKKDDLGLPSSILNSGTEGVSEGV